MHLPRVLIFGQPFNYKHGGGITLSNLFRGWGTNHIAVAATGHVMYGITYDICINYYQLGYNEFRWLFPFNFLQRKFRSGVLQFDKQELNHTWKRKPSLRRIIVEKFFYPFLEWMGLFHSLADIRMTPEFKKWLSDFNPEVLYLQVSSRDTILFAGELIEYLRVPSVIHIMDDWPSTISKRGLLRKYWSKRIEKEFKSLLSRIDLCLSISDAMSTEYAKRYGKNFIAFHNPIDVQLWSQTTKTDFKLNADHIKILFSGRIGVGVHESLLDLAQAVENLYQQGFKIKLYVQSPSDNKAILDKLRSFDSIVINRIAMYSDLPAIFSGADILVIANDFDRKSVEYLRYSMPTKASEYMISGTPVLVYSHTETAVSNFFSSHKCGYCVNERNFEKLRDALVLLIEDENLRCELSTNAVRLAKELFNSEMVKNRFQKLIQNTSLMFK